MKTKSKAGLALAELIVALALLAIIFASLSGTLSFGKRVWQRTETVSQNANSNAHLQILRKYISQAQNISTGYSEAGAPTLFFDGKSSELQFLTYKLSDQDQFTPFEVRISHSTQRQKISLQFDAINPNQTKRLIGLLSGTKTISFRYAKRNKRQNSVSGDYFIWGSEWRNQNRLPDLIELKIEGSGAQFKEPVLQLVVKPNLS